MTRSWEWALCAVPLVLLWVGLVEEPLSDAARDALAKAAFVLAALIAIGIVALCALNARNPGGRT